MLSISLKGKPLCLESFEQNLYIGDTQGKIYKLKYPFSYPKLIITNSSPISAISFYKGEICYGTWNGAVHHKINSKKVGKDQIKCMMVYGDMLFISVDKNLVVLDDSLNCIEKYDTGYKILCMNVFEGSLHLGMATGLISKYITNFQQPCKTGHENNVLAIKDGMTGSVDGTLRKNGIVLFEGNKWIRCIWNENLFSAGNDLFLNNSKLYSHQDEIMGIAKASGVIITIGLDYCYKIYTEFIDICKDEEDEIMSILNS